MQKKHIVLILLPIIGLGALSLNSCRPTAHDVVECVNVPTVNGQKLYTFAGTCVEIAGAYMQPFHCAHWTTTKDYFICSQPTLKVRHYPPEDYVKCYGIATSEQNDGSDTAGVGAQQEKIARSKTAWISIPKNICTQIKGAIVGGPALDGQ